MGDSSAIAQALLGNLGQGWGGSGWHPGPKDPPTQFPSMSAPFGQRPGGMQQPENTGTGTLRGRPASSSGATK